MAKRQDRKTKESKPLAKVPGPELLQEKPKQGPRKSSSRTPKLTKQELRTKIIKMFWDAFGHEDR